MGKPVGQELLEGLAPAVPETSAMESSPGPAQPELPGGPEPSAPDAPASRLSRISDEEPLIRLAQEPYEPRTRPREEIEENTRATRPRVPPSDTTSEPEREMAAEPVRAPRPSRGDESGSSRTSVSVRTQSGPQSWPLPPPRGGREDRSRSPGSQRFTLYGEETRPAKVSCYCSIISTLFR